MALRTRTGGSWTVTSAGDVTGQEIELLHVLWASFDDVGTPFHERTWVDLSARLRSFDVKGGRDSELDDLDATNALHVLDDRDREIDPTNADSNHHPDVVPNRLLWHRIQCDGLTHGVFRGYVDGWGPSWLTTNYGDYVARVRSSDGRKLIAAQTLPAASPDVEEFAEGIVARDPSFYYRVGEPVGSKLVGHKRIIRYKKGEKKGKKKRVARWKTRETRAQTEGVSGPSGTYKNTPLLGRPGAIAGDTDTAVGFRSAQSESAIVSLAQDELSHPNRLTVLCWAKPSALPGAFQFGPLVSGPLDVTGTEPIFDLWVTEFGRYASKLLFSDDSFSDATGSAALGSAPVDVYRMAAFTWDGTTNRLYVNGVLAGSHTPAAGKQLKASNANPQLRIGRWSFGSMFYDGDVDEVVIFERALTATAIKAIFDAAPLGFAGSPTGERVARVLEFVGEFPAWDIQPGVRVMPPARYAGLAAAQLIDEAVEAEGLPAVFLFTKDGVPTLRAADHRDDPPFDAPLYEFGLDDGLIPYESVAISDQDDFLYNIIRVTGEADESTVTATAEDAASIGRFGPIVLDVDGAMLATEAELQALADQLLERYKDPMVRVTEITLNALDPDAREPALALAIGDRVAVTIQPPGGGDPFTQESFIERRALSQSEGQPLIATFAVSPR